MDIVEFTENLVKSLVKEPDLVKVSKFPSDEESTILEILVSESDMGMVIGKGGKTANAIRTIVLAKSYIDGLNKIRVNFDSF